jgi:hypothetical protein
LDLGSLDPAAETQGGAMEVLLYVGGVYCVALILFHLSFWTTFAWAEQLPRLNKINRAIMQVLNLSLTFVFAILAYLSFAHADELLHTQLGRAVLGALALFWLFRSVLQVLFFKLEHWGSWAFLAFFLAGALIYGVPVVFPTL